MIPPPKAKKSKTKRAPTQAAVSALVDEQSEEGPGFTDWTQYVPEPEDNIDIHTNLVTETRLKAYRGVMHKYGQSQINDPVFPEMTLGPLILSQN